MHSYLGMEFYYEVNFLWGARIVYGYKGAQYLGKRFLNINLALKLRTVPFCYVDEEKWQKYLLEIPEKYINKTAF